MKLAVVFGANGGIGVATANKLVQLGCIVATVTRADIDFSDANSDEKICQYLEATSPDLIVNCSGHFPNNKETHNKAMDVNFGSNWSIVKYYMDNPPNKPVKIIMVGSSAYREGRKNYMLYAASKSALYNLWQSCNEYFENGNVSVSLINPVKTKTRMMDPSSTRYLLPNDVAEKIINMSLNDICECIDLSYGKEQ
jgi:short-subunit dehydrogenase